MKSNHKNSNFSSKFLTGLELCRNFILSLNQAKIIVLKDNLEEKRDFLKKVGSNILLQDKTIKYFPRGAWKILENLGSFGAEPRSGEAENGTEKREYSTVLRILKIVRTHFAAFGGENGQPPKI